jgi:hypothetical protein
MSNYTFHVEHDFIPVVVIDSESGSAYVKFAEGRIAKTVNLKEGDVTVNLDLDAGQGILGLEVVGVREFNLGGLIAISGLTAYFTQDVIDRAKYVRSDKQPLVESISADIPETTNT